MNGLKVYLKSGISRIYHHAQGCVGVVLILNALREYEHVEGLKLALLMSVVAGVLLFLGWLMPKSMQRKFRLLPGLLLLLGGLSLIYLTTASLSIGYYRYHKIPEYLGYLISAVGLLQPILNSNQVVYFGTQGIFYHPNLFWKQHMRWSQVNGIVFQEKGFFVELKTGKTLRMVPYDAESQNLRVHIDKMIHLAKSTEEKVSTLKGDGSQRSAKRKSSESVA